MNIFDDLYNVGKTKAVGYLSKRTITEHGKTVEELLEYAKGKVESLVFESGDCEIFSGALFFYDRNMLNSILEQHRDCLTMAGVPIDPVEYIKYIARKTVFQQEHPEAFMAIGLTFNDKRFRQEESA